MGPSVLSKGYRWLVDPYAFLDDARRQDGLTFRTRLPLRGRPLITGDPAVVREISQSADLDAGRGITFLPIILGDRSLITLDGDSHRQRRQLVAPPLHSDAIKHYDSMIVEQTLTEMDALAPNCPFSIYEFTRKISLRMIIRVVFGQQGSEEDRRIETLVESFLNSFTNPLVLFLKWLRTDLGTYSPWGKALRNREPLRAAIQSRIDRCRKTPGATGGVLARLCGSGHHIKDDEVINEALTLLLFGHDTGAATLAWAFAHFYRQSGVVEQIRQEAQDIEADGGGLDPSRHHYLEACLKESMRLCPVVVHLTRVASRDTTIGGHRVSEGEYVFPCAYLAHHNPAVFPDPAAFTPERFLNGNRYPYAYFPFGFGDRTCVGESFAMRQMIIIASTVISRLALAPAPGAEIRPVRQTVLIVPRGGTKMVRMN